jgi:hypothetical protein
MRLFEYELFDLRHAENGNKVSLSGRGVLWKKERRVAFHNNLSAYQRMLIEAAGAKGKVCQQHGSFKNHKSSAFK